MMRTQARGQTMVLFVLSMLLLVLMVTLTLSFTMKVRERIEAQTVADATAYSNAVATARTFNNITAAQATFINGLLATGTPTSLCLARTYAYFVSSGGSTGSASCSGC